MLDLDPSDEMNLFVASGQNIYQYDLRVPSVVMIYTEAVFDLSHAVRKAKLTKKSIA